VIFNIYLVISWNICSINITLLLGIAEIFCGTISYVDTSFLIILPKLYSIVFFCFDTNFLVGFLLAFFIYSLDKRFL
jgi:uncharacterized membrane protein YdcZ (DUF606 family)